MNTFHPPESEPTRLDVVLVSFLGISRVQVQKRIIAGNITVNGDVSSSAHILVSSKDLIGVAEAVTAPHTPPPTPTLTILFEDADVLVVEKASGTLVHPTGVQNPNESTLMDAVLAHFPPMAGVGGDPLRSGVVHRLDREASGVLIFAKHEKAHAWLKNQFKTRKTEKYYDVLVLGYVKDDSGTITFPIARSANGGRMAARPLSQEGKDAITHYTVVTRYSSSTLLRVQIETGRTHQIRAHFFALGHPVAGDTLYTQKNLKQSNTPRLFLHATELHITLPNGELSTFTAPLPQELQDFLATLKPFPTTTTNVVV